MSYTVELGPVGSPNATLDGSDIVSIDVAKPHTALADFDAELPYLRSISDRLLDEARVYNDAGDLLFRGYLKEADWDQERGVVRINGPGIADDLRDTAIEVSYSRTATHDAIQDVWDAHTGFDATVREPSLTERVTDAELQDAPTDDSFGSITSLADTDPFLVDGNGHLSQAQTAFGFEAENDPGTGGTVTGSQYSDGEAGRFEDVNDIASYSFTTDHKIPQDDIGVGFRYELESGNDFDGQPEIELNLNGENVFTALEDASQAGPGWQGPGDNTGYSGDLPADSHTIEIATNTGNSPGINIDYLVVYDARYTPDLNTFDNTTDANGYLSDPPLYPTAATADFVQETTTFNVTGITVNSTWNDTSGSQAIEVSADGGNSYQGVTNGTTVDESYPNNAGTTVDARATFSAYGSRTTATPTDDFQPQVLQDWRLGYDGNDLSVIDDDTFRGTPLRVLQRLHEKADYRFVIDHAATDGGGNLTKSVESFLTGDETKPADWAVVNRQPRLSFQQYANHVTIYGALQTDGSRPTALATDDGEIAQYGQESYSAIRPDLTTIDAVKSEARSTLRKKVGERTQKGTLVVLPTNILPGYERPVDWFADGTTTNSPLERVTFSESGEQLRGRLKFNLENDVTGTVIEQSLAIDTTREGI